VPRHVHRIERIGGCHGVRQYRGIVAAQGSASLRKLLGLSSWSERFPALPPGWAKLATRPAPMGSLWLAITIGIVFVAFLAA